MVTSYPADLWGQMSPTTVKFGDPRNNLSREIAPKAVRGDILDGFFRDNFLPEIVSDVMFDVAVDYVCVDVHATFGEPELNSGRIILLFGQPDKFYASVLSSI